MEDVPRAIERLARDGEAVADAHETAVLLEEARELRVLDADRLDAELGFERRRVRLALAEVGRGARPVELRAALLEAEVGENRLRPAPRGTGTPGSSGSAASIARSSSARSSSSHSCDQRHSPSTSAGAWTTSSPRSAASKRARSAWRGGAGSRTTPPPTVVSVRSTNLSPRAATTGAREPQLREPLAGARDARDGLGRAVVELDTRGQFAGAVEGDVEPEARPKRTGRDEHVAAPDLRAFDAGKRDRDALARLGALDRPVVHLHAAHAHRRPPGSTRSSSPSPIVPDHSVPVTTVPIPRREKERSTWSRAGPFAGCCSTCRRDGRERRAQLVEPGAGARARHDDGHAGKELLHLEPRELERVGVDEIGLRQRDDAAVDAEQAQDREVLVRLRPRSFARVDDEEEEVDAARAGDHRPDEPLVPGHVDDRKLRPVGQLERRVAEVDRDPARVLLGQPVGVLAGQRLDERGLAVVDVPGGADGQRHDHEPPLHAWRRRTARDGVRVVGGVAQRRRCSDQPRARRLRNGEVRVDPRSRRPGMRLEPDDASRRLLDHMPVLRPLEDASRGIWSLRGSTRT